LNDSIAFDIYQRYRDDVYRWAYRLLGRHHDALDAAQDVFLRWLRHSREADLPQNPRGWLRQVTVNRAIDLVRLRRGTTDRADALPARQQSADARARQDELRSDIAGALHTLSAAQRGVLVAKVYDGLTFAQIADELGIGVPTAKTHYLRALRAVRDRLSKGWSPQRTQS
jgi:RNA polymerase sigma-70 factor (ECF subfamily)